MPSTAPRLKNIVGPAIRKRRLALGWSQAKLATRCQLAGWDVSRGVIASIEGRVRWVGDYEVLILAKVLEVKLESLVPEAPDWTRLGLEKLSLPKKPSA